MANPGGRALTGTQNAALLLMTLGEDDAAEILKYMGTKDVQRIGTAMATLANVSKDHAEQVLTNFITDIEDPANYAVGTEDYVRKVLSNAFGEGKATAFINRIMSRCLEMDEFDRGRRNHRGRTPSDRSDHHRLFG
jgi:flagellar motor switch protein FliG